MGFCVILHHTIIGGCNASAGHVMVARGCTEGRRNIHVCIEKELMNLLTIVPEITRFRLRSMDNIFLPKQNYNFLNQTY